MSFCNKCGVAVQGGANCCSSCGAALSNFHDFDSSKATFSESSTPTGVAARMPLTAVDAGVMGAATRKAGRMAVKTFLLAWVAFLVVSVLTRHNGTASIVAFGGAALYIIYKIKTWGRNPITVVEGKGLAYSLAALLVLFTIAGIQGKDQNSIENRKENILQKVTLTYHWSKGGLDSIMVADFEIENRTHIPFKDFVIECTDFAPSGTKVDSHKKTIYQIVDGKSTLYLKQENMGFINSQAISSSCKITDIIPVI